MKDAIPSAPTDFIIEAAWRALRGLVVVVVGPEGAGKSVGGQRARLVIQRKRRATKVLYLDKTSGSEAGPLARHIYSELGMTADDVLGFTRSVLKKIQGEVEESLASPTLHSFLQKLAQTSYLRPRRLMDILRAIETAPAFVKQPSLATGLMIMKDF